MSACGHGVYIAFTVVNETNIKYHENSRDGLVADTKSQTEGWAVAQKAFCRFLKTPRNDGLNITEKSCFHWIAPRLLNTA